MMKNIFLESHNIRNLNFGFGQFNYHLIKRIFNHGNQDFRITLHVPGDSFVKNEFGDFFDYRNYYSLRRYPLFGIRKKYNLWHSMNQNSKIEPQSKTPYLLTVHNISHIEDATDYLNKENHVRFQNKLSKSAALVYISEYARQSTHQYFSTPDVPEYVVYNGNPMEGVPVDGNFKAEFQPKRPFLFSIGEITDRKNFKSLVPLLTSIKDFDLIIAGKDSMRCADELRELIKKYKLENRFFLIGKISEEEKRFYYQNCAAFVFPSLREGFGLPVIEAMWFGKPVFTSHNTSLPEIGSNIAFYWKNYDPEEMKNVFESGMNHYEENREKYAQKAMEHAKSFSWDNAAASYLKIYESLI